MKTIFKIALVTAGVAIINTSFAQNALQARNIKKAEATTSVKSQAVTAEKSSGINNASATQQRQEAPNSQMMQSQPTSVKQAATGEVKSPAQMAKQPLKKQVVFKEGEAAKKENLK